MNIKLLDCTLRDGGYNNDWEFGHNTLVNVFDRVVSAGLDFIEVGFLDQRRPFDINRSIMPDSLSANRIYGGLDKKHTEVVAMIDYGTCDLDYILPCSESFIDGIRVIFKMDLMYEALEYCKQLKEKGYKVFTQAVSFTAYTDEKIMELISLVNEVKPFAVSVVDTYGLMFKSNLFHYYQVIDKYLDSEIGIGYHAHNNFQLAFSNCIELAKLHANNPRMLLLDGSLFGMGKGCGNAPLELLAMYMNDEFHCTYDLNQILEAIDINVIELYRQLHWGYSLKGFIAASNDCHPNYISFLLDKQTLSVKSINEILKNLEGKAKLLYDQSYIERLYTEYQINYCNDDGDYQQLTKRLEGKQVMVIGPGVTVKAEAAKIAKAIEKFTPTVIAINFIPENFNVDYLFLTNSKRYVQQVSHIQEKGNKIKIIATSNVTKASGSFDFNMDYETLIDRDAVFIDNSFIMLMKILKKCGVKDVLLCGLDGYSANREVNYYTSKMEYEHSKRLGEEINRDVNKNLIEFRKSINIEFVTTTLYEQ